MTLNTSIDYCREVFAENERELKNVKRLERKYRDETPIWWYTYECFLYPMLNRALRLMVTEIIFKMDFFIDGLHRHIEQLHKKQFSGYTPGNSFTVYRGQGMSKTEFEETSQNRMVSPIHQKKFLLTKNRYAYYVLNVKNKI